MRFGPGKNDAAPLVSGAGFARFYEQNERQLVRYFARKVYDPQLALDLAAETFAQAFVARRRFSGSPESDARAWLFTIARRQLSRYYRRGLAELKAIERLGLERPHPDTAELQHVERLASLDQARETLGSGLEVLKDEERLAIRLRVVEELPYAEVARRLGVSEPTARARVSRSLKALAQALDLELLAEEMTT